jgi:hypothetical protein
LGAPAITTLTNTAANQTLTVNFGSLTQGIGIMTSLLNITNNLSITTPSFSFTNAVIYGSYTLILPFSSTSTNTVTLSAYNTTSPTPLYKCNFTSIVLSATTTTKYIILSVAYDSTNLVYFISGSTFG